MLNILLFHFLQRTYTEKILLLKNKKIVITGGDGRFAKVLKQSKNKFRIYYPNKKKLNILKIDSIKNYLKRVKPKYLIHAAGLSRPMKLHDKYISKSIDLNIIGTCNVVKVCSDLNIKLIYFSTGYVYEVLKVIIRRSCSKTCKQLRMV